MALVNKTRTYSTGDNLTAAYYNEDRDEVIAGVNSIDNAQVDGSAGIEESKLAFSGSGHGHTGGSDGKQISTGSLDLSGFTPLEFIRLNAAGTALESAEVPGNTRGYAFYDGSDPCSVLTDLSVNPRVASAQTAVRISAYAKTAPTGADLIAEVRTIAGTLIASITIPAGSQQATSTTIASPTLAEGTILRMDVSQVGSTVAGSKVSVTLDTTVD